VLAASPRNKITTVVPEKLASHQLPGTQKGPLSPPALSTASFAFGPLPGSYQKLFRFTRALFSRFVSMLPDLCCFLAAKISARL